MRKRPIAVSAALTLSAAALTPGAAHADSSGPTTYYVGRCSSATGTGTQADPFCTIQQAAAVATVPGDTVLIQAGQYIGEVDITASGTAAAPITYQSVPIKGYSHVTIIARPTDAHDLDISGSSHVNVVGISLEGFGESSAGEESSLVVHDSDHISVDGDPPVSRAFAYVFGGPPISQPTVLIDGSSSYVTLSRMVIRADAGASAEVEVAATGTGNTVMTNGLTGASAGVVVDGAPGTVVTSNSFGNTCAPVSVVDSATSVAAGVVIENNVFNAAPAACTTASGISVPSATDTASALENYNTFRTSGGYGAAEYAWAGASYPTQAAFHSATGQGAADYDTSFGGGEAGTTPATTDPIIDAADSDAPGELATDVDGTARSCDPNVLPSGTGHSPCYDRGAVESTDAVSLSWSGVAPIAPVKTPITFDAGTATSDWAGATFSYTFDFGDGTVITSSNPVVSHSYSVTYANASATVRVTATSKFGGVAVESAVLNLSPFTTLTSSLSIAPTSALGASATVIAWSGWTVTGTSINWGDGASATNIGDNNAITHTYASPGVYKVVYTVTNSGGQSSTSTYLFATSGNEYVPHGPTRILDTRRDLGGTSAQLANDGQIKVKVAGVDGIPAKIGAVALNLTALDATGAGYIQSQAGNMSTNTSIVNYNVGGVYTNSVIAPVSSDGYIVLADVSSRISTKLDLLADISGYFAPEVASGYTPVTPARLMDTRTGLGGSTGKLGAGKADVLTITGADRGVLPASGITAVAVNLTIAGTVGTGYLAAYPDGGSVPGTSNENWSGTTVKAITAIVPVGADGKIDVYNGGLRGSAADVIVDVTGYFSAASTSMYVPAAVPTRVFDTRRGTGPIGGDATASQTIPTNQSASGLPLPVTAYVMNTTVTQTGYPGWLAVVPHGTTPASSSLNWTGAGQTVANLTITPSGGAAQLDYYNGGANARPIQVIGDLLGYFTTA